MGFKTTGEYLQLNSYENRVFSLKTEHPDHPRVIAKFYRPGRWSREAILEEHQFLTDLSAQGVEVVAPLKQNNGMTLSLQNELFTALFPKALGRMPQEFTLTDLSRLGRVLARLHNVGSLKESSHRPIIDVVNMGRPALEILKPLILPQLRERYLNAAEEILDWLQSEMDHTPFIRIHGDCHRGNVLQTDEPGKPSDYLLVDFDDFGMGPVVQDFWMLFRHDESDVEDEINAFLAGYSELRDFDESQLELMTPLRGLRIIHYAAWIARRWQDPNFPRLFPQFATDSYWLDELKALEELL